MKTTIVSVLLAASLVSANQKVHNHLQSIHRRHHERLARSTQENPEQGVEIRSAAETSPAELEKRGGQCQFPYEAGLVPVTPGMQNAGWALPPDQPCKPGNYCPYACPPGQVMMQWDPSATSYSYPKSMNGGLFCDNSGNVQKPFPDKPYCQSTNSNIGVVNQAGGGGVAFCQTVLPGREDMLIPTLVQSSATLANPGPDYWCGTAAHYYINAPGVGIDAGCVWGSSDKPYGNWAPYVAGSNVDANGQTFIKLGWNPIYLEPTTPFRNEMPNWGVKIECPNGGCNGLPCAIDPIQNRVNQMKGAASNGAGGGAFCVVTVQPGSQANFVITGGSGGNAGGPWNNGGPGQFFPGGPGGPGGSQTSSSTATTTTASSSSTTSWSDWSQNSTSTSFSKNSSTTAYGPSSHGPYMSLFNTASTLAVPTASATSQKAGSSAGPSIAVATGGASSYSWTSTGIAIVGLAGFFAQY